MKVILVQAAVSAAAAAIIVGFLHLVLWAEVLEAGSFSAQVFAGF
jgi:hypothetical protein